MMIRAGIVSATLRISSAEISASVKPSEVRIADSNGEGWNQITKLTKKASQVRCRTRILGSKRKRSTRPCDFACMRAPVFMFEGKTCAPLRNAKTAAGRAMLVPGLPAQIQGNDFSAFCKADRCLRLRQIKDLHKS